MFILSYKVRYKVSSIYFICPHKRQVRWEKISASGKEKSFETWESGSVLLLKKLTSTTTKQNAENIEYKTLDFLMEIEIQEGTSVKHLSMVCIRFI